MTTISLPPPDATPEVVPAALAAAQLVEAFPVLVADRDHLGQPRHVEFGVVLEGLLHQGGEIDRAQEAGAVGR